VDKKIVQDDKMSIKKMMKRKSSLFKMLHVCSLEHEVMKK